MWKKTNKIAKIVLMPVMIILFLATFTMIGVMIYGRYRGIVLVKDFDAALFIEKTGSTRNDLLLFTDIAATYGRIFKWESDIKVEVIDVAHLTPEEIAEVDSVITLLAPLISPVKIERVSKNGNFRVYRKVENIQQLYPEKIGVDGFAHYDKKSFLGQIRQVSVFESNKANNGVKVLMHEFLHGVGLSHASKVYPFPLHIGSERRYVFASRDAYEAYQEIENRYLLSPQEGQVLRMLYSPMIKPGMRIEQLKEKFGIKHEK